MSGTLYVVGTPIGNLEDITLRALRILRSVQVIAAEDTRHTRKLLQHFDLHIPLVAVHEHNERQRAGTILERLAAGDDVALVTDAGMPTVSDPGAHLVAQTVAAGFAVVPVPGPSAVITALAGSGLPVDQFVFEGFLPRRGRERSQRLALLAREPRAVVLYEAPHRLLVTLRDLATITGDRQLVVARELTKRYEEFQRGTAAEALAHFTAHPPRGEFTIVIAPAAAMSAPTDQPAGPAPTVLPPTAFPQPVQPVARGAVGGGAGWVAAVRSLEEQGLPRKEAMRQVAQLAGVSRRQVYQALLVAESGPGEAKQ